MIDDIFSLRWPQLKAKMMDIFMLTAAGAMILIAIEEAANRQIKKPYIGIMTLRRFSGASLLNFLRSYGRRRSQMNRHARHDAMRRRPHARQPAPPRGRRRRVIRPGVVATPLRQISRFPPRRRALKRVEESSTIMKPYAPVITRPRQRRSARRGRQASLDRPLRELKPPAEAAL